MDDETRAEIRAAVAEAIAATQQVVEVDVPTPAEQIAVDESYQEAATDRQVAVIEANAAAAVEVIEAAAAAEVEVIEATAKAEGDTGDGLAGDLGDALAGDEEPTVTAGPEPTPDHWLLRPIGRKS